MNWFSSLFTNDSSASVNDSSSHNKNIHSFTGSSPVPFAGTKNTLHQNNKNNALPIPAASFSESHAVVAGYVSNQSSSVPSPSSSPSATLSEFRNGIELKLNKGFNLTSSSLPTTIPAKRWKTSEAIDMDPVDSCDISNIEKKLLLAFRSFSDSVVDEKERKRHQSAFIGVDDVSKSPRSDTALASSDDNPLEPSSSLVDQSSPSASSEDSFNSSNSTNSSLLFVQNSEKENTRELTALTNKPCAQKKESLSLGASTHIGGKPVNQDISFCIGLKTGCDSSVAVFDGHGKYGRQIARKVHDYFIKKIVELISPKERAKNGSPQMNLEQADINFLLSKYFSEIEALICDDKKHSIKSGTTATVAIQKGGKLYIASTGDSRAVMASSSWDDNEKRNTFSAKRMTTDHRFDVESEYNMVITAGGIIHPREGKDDGALRVWVSEKKSRELGLRSPAPGLMVSRSVGDYLAKVAGCSAVPETSSFEIRPENKFLIVASDGLWDILSDEDAVNIVSGFDHARDSSWAKISAEKLIRAALDRSTQRHFIPDNITVAIMDLERLYI